MSVDSTRPNAPPSPPRRPPATIPSPSRVGFPLMRAASPRHQVLDSKMSYPSAKFLCEERVEADKRELQFGGAFGGALLTSGSFTMMAASGGF